MFNTIKQEREKTRLRTACRLEAYVSTRLVLMLGRTLVGAGLSNPRKKKTKKTGCQLASYRERGCGWFVMAYRAARRAGLAAAGDGALAAGAGSRVFASHDVDAV